RSKPFVAASIGPYGAYLADGSEYRGNYELTEEQLMDFHRPRMRALIEAGADILACETIPCLIEAQALSNLLKEFASITAWFSFSAKDGEHISEGSLFADCVKEIESNPQIVAVGINCTSPRYVPSLIREAKQITNKPILAYPNSGESYSAEKKDWNSDPFSTSFGEQAHEWYDAGARMIGGCCRSTVEDIQTIASWIRSHE
ncbi:MAG TPA: homocysteine S-methyltransferase, partial [Anaerolineales bacterium]